MNLNLYIYINLYFNLNMLNRIDSETFKKNLRSFNELFSFLNNIIIFIIFIKLLYR